MRRIRLRHLKPLLHFYRWLLKCSKEMMYIAYLLKEGGLTFLARQMIRDKKKHRYIQQIRLERIPYCADYRDFRSWLIDQNIAFTEGKYTFYIPPQKLIVHIFKPLHTLYPITAGFKILKDFRPVRKAHYVSRTVNHEELKASELFGNSLFKILDVANYLHERELGPRVYDLVEVYTGVNYIPVYIVEHVQGVVPFQPDCSNFLVKISGSIEKDIFPIHRDWKKHKDFVCPDCNNNLIKSVNDGRIYYVDFNTFFLRR